MKLLIVAPSVNTQNRALGFFVRWVELFARKAEKVTVLALEVGSYNLPGNVKVIPLGVGSFERAKNLIVLSFKLRKEYDSVFIHMGQVFVVTAGWLWRLLGKKTVLWYTHKQVSFSLRVAVFFVNAVVSAVKESFRIRTSKLHIIGHGIDLSHFYIGTQLPPERGENWNLLSLSRATRIKNIDVMIKTLKVLKEREMNVHLTIVGSPVTEDDTVYVSELHALVKKLQLEEDVTFRPGLPHEEIMRVFQRAHVHLNFCPTGGLDKAVMDGMACGAVPFVRNAAFTKAFGARAHHWINISRDPQELASSLAMLLKSSVWVSDHQAAARIARSEFDLGKLIEKILGML